MHVIQRSPVVVVEVEPVVVVVPEVEYDATQVSRCDTCGRSLRTLGRMVDGRLQSGIWAMMCLACHYALGVGLGIGRGQQFALFGERWLKVAPRTGR